MALVGVELQTLVSEPDSLTTRPPPCATAVYITVLHNEYILFFNIFQHLIKLVLDSLFYLYF